jgi:hypothetical protein
VGQKKTLSVNNLKFNSSERNLNAPLKRLDYKNVQGILESIKQIPAGQRSYNPQFKIWTIPEETFIVVEILVKIINPKGMVPWNNLFPQTSTPNSNNEDWTGEALKRAKVEVPEEFFNSYSVVSEALAPSVLQEKLQAIVRPYVLNAPETREDFIRAYKITARKLHPDMATGNAKLMTELNSLWMQYKEICK